MNLEDLDLTSGDQYYHIFCPDCETEEYLPGDIPLIELSDERRAVCPCDATYQEVIEHRKHCDRCGEQPPVDSIAGMDLCMRCIVRGV